MKCNNLPNIYIYILRRGWAIPVLRPLVKFLYQQRISEHIPEISLHMAKTLVSTMSRRPEGSSCWQMPDCDKFWYDLSVIIPFYKSEQYARKCVDSVMSQRCDYRVEIILVDDGSPDRCGEIIDSYAHCENVTVIHQENQGAAVARNTGIAAAKGEYLMFVDSDDWLAEGAVQALMQTARAHNADIVEGSHQTTTNDEKTRRMYLHEKRISTGGNGMFGYPWGKVLRRNLYKNVCYPNGYWYEDSIIATLIHPAAEITVTIPELVLYYRANPVGYTASGAGNPRSVDTYYIVEDILNTYQLLGRPMNDQIKRQLLRQLGPHLIGRVQWMGEEYIQALFVLAKDLAYKNGLLPAEKTGDFFFDEFCDALALGQYFRWKYAALMA